MRNGGRGERKRNSPERDPNFFTQRHGRETLRGFPESPQRDLPQSHGQRAEELLPRETADSPPKAHLPDMPPAWGREREQTGRGCTGKTK